MEDTDVAAACGISCSVNKFLQNCTLRSAVRDIKDNKKITSPGNHRTHRFTKSFYVQGLTFVAYGPETWYRVFSWMVKRKTFRRNQSPPSWVSYNMKIRISKTLVTTYQTTRRYNPEHIINIYSMHNTYWRSQWPRGLRLRSAAPRLLRSWVRIPPRAWMFVCCECCVLSGRGLCDELITRPEESYRLCCVVVCDL